MRVESLSLFFAIVDNRLGKLELCEPFANFLHIAPHSKSAKFLLHYTYTVCHAGKLEFRPPSIPKSPFTNASLCPPYGLEDFYFQLKLPAGVNAKEWTLRGKICDDGSVQVIGPCLPVEVIQNDHSKKVGVDCEAGNFLNAMG
ncbi:hypothetical protein CEXT_230261 [Caerostris extrusa]|uniref:Uncharacterized protein n=1 Tax=Caerostris extrusa TaxID=172846 RepID=A0AAV4XF94_CAEEX|nr:hypothetical protein CEXT_230261 [Caerostris extrusa]